MKMRLQDGVLIEDKINGKDVNLNIHQSKVGPRGRVRGKIAGTNITLFESWNKVICDGSMFVGSKCFDILPPVNLPTYNTSLNLENVVPLLKNN